MEENKQLHKTKVSSAETEASAAIAKVAPQQDSGASEAPNPNNLVGAPNADHPRTKWGPYELRPSPKAILRLSLGTSAAIATALAIPDAFSLLPGAPSFTSWAVRLAGLWMYAYLLWAVGFLTLLHIVRLIGGGLKLDSDGIKLGKFEKPIRWEQIEFIAIQERKAFSRAFFIEARELKMHIRKADNKITVKSIPSFQFTTEQFFSLFQHICFKTAGVKVRSFRVMVFRDPSSKFLRKQAEQGRVKRVLLTILIASSLLLFLGRKSAVNYYFNLGNQQSKALNEKKAAEHYKTATQIDWTFPPAWDRLARSEFRTGDIESARQHWQKALSVKPDYVESKLGLATIYMREGNIEEADKLIFKANRLAEYDEAGYLNRALIESLKGNNSQAIALLVPFVKQSVGRDMAICSLARFYVKNGDFDLARNALATPSLVNAPQLKDFVAIVSAELALAENRIDDAAESLSHVDKSKLNDYVIHLDFANLYIAQNKLADAERELLAAAQINKTSPWIALANAKLCAARGDKNGAAKHLKYCLSWRYQDPTLMAACAEFMENQKDFTGAKILALKALSIDGNNKVASNLSLRLNKPEPEKTDAKIQSGASLRRPGASSRRPGAVQPGSFRSGSSEQAQGAQASSLLLKNDAKSSVKKGGLKR